MNLQCNEEKKKQTHETMCREKVQPHWISLLHRKNTGKTTDSIHFRWITILWFKYLCFDKFSSKCCLLLSHVFHVYLHCVHTAHTGNYVDFRVKNVFVVRFKIQPEKKGTKNHKYKYYVHFTRGIGFSAENPNNPCHSYLCCCCSSLMLLWVWCGEPKKWFDHYHWKCWL